MFFVSDNPIEHKRISKIERDYIVMSLAESTHKETGKVYSIILLTNLSILYKGYRSMLTIAVHTNIDI